MMKPITNQAYKLLHDGCIALSQVEANGIKIDEDYLHKAIKKTAKRIERQNEELKKDKIFKTWQKRYGQKTNIDSNQQLGEVLFNILKYDCPGRTKTGLPKTDEDTLESKEVTDIAVENGTLYVGTKDGAYKL